jgi:hypothetical protein
LNLKGIKLFDLIPLVKEHEGSLYVLVTDHSSSAELEVFTLVKIDFSSLQPKGVSKTSVEIEKGNRKDEIKIGFI